jgi:hypothetical protein
MESEEDYKSSIGSYEDLESKFTNESYTINESKYNDYTSESYPLGLLNYNQEDYTPNKKEIKTATEIETQIKNIQEETDLTEKEDPNLLEEV